MGTYTGLSISVKHLMDSHNVNYSMTTHVRKKSRYIVVNMRVGNDWFITGYDEIKGDFYNWDLIQTLSRAIELIHDYFSLQDDDSE